MIRSLTASLFNLRSLATAFFAVAIMAPAIAQFEVTEIMYNPASDEDDWEWIEVRNTTGVEQDLDGFWMDGVGDGAAPQTGASPNISSTGAVTQSTTVPANGVAVLYNGFDLDYDESRFRAAWPSMPASAPLIAVNFWANLGNGPPAAGEMIGFWADETSYRMDQMNVASMGEEDDFDIVQVTNAAFVAAYDNASPWPNDDGAASIQYNGNGSDRSDGANWSLSVAGSNGAVASTETFLSGTQFRNNPSDLANPGINHGGTAPSGLLITEVMYNPASSDADWEWVEVFNNTGSSIDMAGYVFDDNDNDDYAAANIAAGTVAQGEHAILYDGDAVSLADMQTAWGNLNFIAVSEFTALTNSGDESGDTLALWDSLSDYTSETTTGDGRSTDNAVVSLTYLNNADGWPDDNGQSSIFLSDLGADPTVGTNWQLSGVDSEDFQDFLSFNATGIPDGGMTVDNSGMDIGSPGIFEEEDNVLLGDFDNDGDVDIVDFGTFANNFGMTGLPLDPATDGDFEPDGDVDIVDFGTFGANFGTGVPGSAIPEPASFAMLALAIAALPVARRR